MMCKAAYIPTGALVLVNGQDDMLSLVSRLHAHLCKVTRQHQATRQPSPDILCKCQVWPHFTEEGMQAVSTAPQRTGHHAKLVGTNAHLATSFHPRTQYHALLMLQASMSKNPGVMTAAGAAQHKPASPDTPGLTSSRGRLVKPKVWDDGTEAGPAVGKLHRLLVLVCAHLAAWGDYGIHLRLL